MDQAMMRNEYMIAVTEAMAAAQVEPEVGLVVDGDAMRAIASHLSTEALRAVVANKIITTDQSGDRRSIPMHPGWVAACDDELVDRLLTESLNEGKELQEKASPEEGERKEAKKKGAPQVYR
jgi:hypothetical protein